MVAGKVACVDPRGESTRFNIFALQEAGGLDNFVIVFEGDRVKRLVHLTFPILIFLRPTYRRFGTGSVIWLAISHVRHGIPRCKRRRLCQCFKTILRRNLLTPVRGTLIVSPSRFASRVFLTQNHNTGFSHRDEPEYSSPS